MTAILCLFCGTFSHEDEDIEQKWKRTINAKYFSYPWQTDNFSCHLKQQVEEKEKFFVKNESAEVFNMQSFVQLEGSMKACIIAPKQQCQFIIDADIIETLIFGLLFNNLE